ncbi:hypothetical protein [Sciscionella marina]|uniref:hypothetical protein n=1 Tax=Sciscionella marina TaxID=508770 RepID=UPI00037226A8|nr:hypothetical protein [Sciscionella marina]
MQRAERDRAERGCVPCGESSTPSRANGFPTRKITATIPPTVALSMPASANSVGSHAEIV